MDECLSSLGATICELVMPLKFRALSPNAPLDDRLSIARDIVITNISHIPRSLRRTLKILLHIDDNVNVSIFSI